MNLCVFTGRLTYDPELKSTTTGKSVVSFSIAVNEGKDSNGNELVTFVNCEAWERQADFISTYFTKGKALTVQGRLKQDRWDDKTTGEKRSTYKVVVDKVSFVPGSGNGQQENVSVDANAKTEPTAPKKRGPKAKTTPVNEEVTVGTSGFETQTDDDDDIPF